MHILGDSFFLPTDGVIDVWEHIMLHACTLYKLGRYTPTVYLIHLQKCPCHSKQKLSLHVSKRMALV